MIRRLLATAALLTAVPAFADAGPKVPTLTVSAEGHTNRAPDVADLSGGVVTTAATAAGAMAANATQMSAVVAAVRKAGIVERDIQTSGLSLAPQYKYADNQPPVLTGYQATNSVSLRVRKLNDAGRLVDALVAAGANQISGPTFRIDAADAALDEARVSAVATARARADLYAKAASLHVKRIVSISESGGEGPVIRPMAMMLRAKGADSTPVVPGEVSLSITVNMVFEVE